MKKVSVYGFLTMLIIVIITLFFALNTQKPSKNVENLLKTVEIYLPGEMRPSHVECFDYTGFDEQRWVNISSFYCRIDANTRVYGTDNIINGVSLLNVDDIAYGDLLLYYGQPRSEFNGLSQSTYIWYNCVAYSDVSSMNPLFSPIRRLYFYG